MAEPVAEPVVFCPSCASSDTRVYSMRKGMTVYRGNKPVLIKRHYRRCNVCQRRFRTTTTEQCDSGYAPHVIAKIFPSDDEGEGDNGSARQAHA